MGLNYFTRLIRDEYVIDLEWWILGLGVVRVVGQDSEGK